MLFLLNKTDGGAADLVKLLGGQEDKALLLVQDAVYYSAGPMLKSFKEAGVEEIYAAQDALEERALKPEGGVEAVSYARMVELIMEEHDKVVCI